MTMSLHLVTLCEESMKKAYLEADDDGADDNTLAQIDPEEGGEEEPREDDPEDWGNSINEPVSSIVFLSKKNSWWYVSKESQTVPFETTIQPIAAWSTWQSKVSRWRLRATHINIYIYIYIHHQPHSF